MPAPGASGPIPTAEPPAWARVRLIEGQSAATVWQVDSSISTAQLGVGAQESCSWRVTAPRVAPLHFELCWDGSRLWIGDTQQAGGVTIDGVPLAGWLPVSGRARIEFGGAVMLAESSQPAVSVAAAERGAVDDDDPTRIRPDAGFPAPQPRRPDTAEEPTIPVTSLPKVPGAAADVRSRLPRPSDPAQTIIAQIYDRAPSAYVPGAPMGWASSQPPPAMPGTPPPPAQPGTPPPPDPRRPAMRPGAMPPGPYAHAAGTPPAGSKAGNKIARSLRSVPPRTWALGGITAAALAVVLFMGGGGDEAAPAAGGQEAAAEAPSAQVAEAEAETGPAGDEAIAQPLEGAGEADEAGGGGSEGDEAAGSGEADVAAGGGEGDEAGDSERAASGGEGGEAGDSKEATAATDDEAATAEDDVGAAAMATEKEAAELLLAGRRRDALAVYGELARLQPDRPAFAAIVTILERELAERCPEGGESCK